MLTCHWSRSAESVFGYAILVLLACHVPVARADGTFRTWTSDSGTYSTEAEMVWATQESVMLHIKVGELRETPIVRLATADQEYIRANALAVERSAKTIFRLQCAAPRLPAHCGFCFFTAQPSVDQVLAGREYLMTRLQKLGTDKVEIPGNNDGGTGFDVMGLLASNAGPDRTMHFAPFHGVGNRSGTYGLCGEFFQIGSQQVLVLVVFCQEVDQKETQQHSFDFADLGLSNTQLDVVQGATQVYSVTCSYPASGKMTFGPGGLYAIDAASPSPPADNQPSESGRAGPTSIPNLERTSPAADQPAGLKNAGNAAGALDARTKSQASTRILVLRETGFAGAPVKEPQQWYDLDLSQLAVVDTSAELRNEIDNIFGAPQVYVDSADSVNGLFREYPDLSNVVIVYVNSGSLRCQVSGLSGNMIVRRRSGDFELMMHPEHRDFGPATPKGATFFFFRNYSSAFAVVIARENKHPRGYEYALDQSQTPLPADADFRQLIRSVLSKGTVAKALASTRSAERTAPTVDANSSPAAAALATVTPTEASPAARHTAEETAQDRDQASAGVPRIGVTAVPTGKAPKVGASKQAGNASRPRTWTNDMGRTVVAEFIRVDGEMGEIVVIKRSGDGRLFEVPLTNLSPADQAFVAQARKAVSADDEKNHKK
jgi:hypothetical protein